MSSVGRVSGLVLGTTEKNYIWITEYKEKTESPTWKIGASASKLEKKLRNVVVCVVVGV